MNFDSRPLTNEARAILIAFSKGSYTLRTLDGIAKDASLGKELVNRTLNELVARGLVDQVLRNGEVYFFLTTSGRGAVYQLEQEAQGSLASLLNLISGNK